MPYYSDSLTPSPFPPPWPFPLFFSPYLLSLFISPFPFTGSFPFPTFLVFKFYKQLSYWKKRIQDTEHRIYRIQNTTGYRTLQDTEHRIYRIQNTGYPEYTGYITHDIQDTEQRITGDKTHDIQDTEHRIYRIQNTGYTGYRTQDMQDTEHRIYRIQNT